MKPILLCLCLSVFYLNTKGNQYYRIDVQENEKSSAFKVLTTKCNVCHRTKKRQDIFTLKNMDSLAFDINTQVFIKKKMPKGRKIKLTEAEIQVLRDWLVLILPEKE